MLLENVISTSPYLGGSTHHSLAPNRGVLKESPRMSAPSAVARAGGSWSRPAVEQTPTNPTRLATLVTRWSLPIDLWLNGGFHPVNPDSRSRSPMERHLYDDTMVTRTAIVRAVLGARAVGWNWANDTVDAVMDVPAWRRIIISGDVVAYRIRNSNPRGNEKLAPL